MNSYHENLNAVVLTALQMQSLDEKSSYSELNANIFKLYYAQGATVAAREKFVEAKKDIKIKEDIKNATIHSANLSNNLLSTATDANQYNKQAVTNASVCAANVQIAANAIVRLASDIGSVFSIIQAADLDAAIYQISAKLRTLTDDIALAAEQASQLAMETSMYTAEISTSTVLDKVTGTNTGINNLLDINSKAFENALIGLNNDHDAFANASVKEKLAEGALQNIDTVYKAAKQAYNLTNKELNLDLRVAKDDDTNYSISFNQLNSPFGSENFVEDYHLIFVKDSKKATFSISNAEVIKGNNHFNQYISVLLKGKKTDKVKMSLNFLNFLDGKDVNSNHTVIDSDGEAITYGVKYVVFVMAVFTNSYKKEINNFDDFLSAPSKEFVLTQTLNPVDGRTIKVEQLNQIKSKEEIKMLSGFIANQHIESGSDEQDFSNYTHKITFTTNIEESYQPVHRCIFLPQVLDSDDNLLVNSYSHDLIKSYSTIIDDNDVKLSFIFNLKIAEQVSPGNYIQMNSNINDQTLQTRVSKKNNIVKKQVWSAFFGSETTDSFGNLLVDGKTYYPIILTVSKDSLYNSDYYTNALSQISESGKFLFELKRTKKQG